MNLIYLIARLFITIDLEVRGASLEYLLLGVQLSIRVPGVALYLDWVSRLAASWRTQDLNLFWSRCTHHHGLRHDATHLAWLEVAEENSHPVLHLVFRYKLDQARDDCAWLFFSNINLSKYFKISLITANHNRKTFPVWLRNRLISAKLEPVLIIQNDHV